AGVPHDVNNERIKEVAGCVEAYRIVKRRGGATQPTMAVVLSYETEDSVPPHVQLGYLRFKVRPFVPDPLRCYQCQQYGHRGSQCRKQKPVCPVCAGGHKFENCDKKTA